MQCNECSKCTLTVQNLRKNDFHEFKAVAYCRPLNCYITAKTYNSGSCLSSCELNKANLLSTLILEILARNRKVYIVEEI